ncbi:MAG TPA: SDR family oxidoreductase [Kofleriaceae bacterium]
MSELRGKRALVTGASSGLGACFAKLLADRGCNVVLTARRESQLTEVAAECEKRGVKAEIIVGDLGVAGGAKAVWGKAGAIDVLINNAGFGYFRRFTTVEAERDAELLQVNVMALVELSKLFLAERERTGERGWMLNIASTAAYQSIPNFAVYASSKAFVRNFTEALSAEYAGSPITISCLCPGGTHTEFHHQAGAGNYGWLANKSMLSAQECAEIGLRAMERGKRNVVSGALNKLSCFGVRLVPRKVSTWMSTRVLGRPKKDELPGRTVGALK